MPRVPPPGKRIQKGEARNPRGSSDKARSLGKLRRLTNAQVEEVGAIVLEGNRAKLRAIGEDEDATVLQVWMASLIVSSMRKGDPAAFRAILDRLLGRPKESVTVSGDEAAPLRVDVSSMTHEQKLQRVAELSKRRLEAGDD